MITKQNPVSPCSISRMINPLPLKYPWLDKTMGPLFHNKNGISIAPPEFEVLQTAGATSQAQIS